jgi:hypothetical protein
MPRHIGRAFVLLAACAAIAGGAVAHAQSGGGTSTARPHQIHLKSGASAADLMATTSTKSCPNMGGDGSSNGAGATSTGV